MARPSIEERRKALEERTRQSIKNRDKGEGGGSGILNLSGLNVNFYKPKTDRKKNYIDLVPFIVSEEWYAKSRNHGGEINSGMEPGYDDYKLEIPVHSFIGPGKKSFVCPERFFGKKCPLCEMRKAEYDKNEEDKDEKLIKTLNISWRVFYNVYDYDNPEKGIQLWSNVSYANFEKHFLTEANTAGDDGTPLIFSDPETGKSIEFKCREKHFEKFKYYEADSIEFYDRDQYDDEALKDSYPLDKLLVLSDYDEILNEFMGVDEEEGESKPQRPKGRQKQRNKKDETEEKENTSDDVIPDDEAPFDEGNPCSAGLRFGIDTGEKDECGDCSEEDFKACAAKQDGETTEKEEVKTRAKKETRKRGRPRGK